MKSRLLLFILYVNVGFLNAQFILPDSSTVDYRTYSEQSIEFYQLQNEYNYDLNPKYEQNPLKRLWYKFWRELLEKIGQRTLSTTWEIVKYLVIFLGVFLFARFLFRSSKTSIFSRADKSPDDPGVLIKSEEGGTNLNRLISEAERSNDFPLAIRYRYLQILRDLDHSGKIKWRDYKTNFDYYREIKGETLSGEFLKLSDYFEYVVYGDYKIDREKYDEIKSEFNLFLHTGTQAVKG